MENLKKITEVDDPFKKKEDPFKKKDDPFKKKDDPFKKKEDPFVKKDDPFKKKEDPFKKKGDGKKDKIGDEEVEQKDKFPINSIELSNLFRDWLNDTQLSYASTNKIERTITDKTKIAEDSIKNAWAEFGDKYIKWLAGTYDDVLVSIGLDLDKANSEWKKGEGQKITAISRQKEQQQLEKTKCNAWTSGNLIKGHLSDKTSIEWNELTEKFVNWCDTNGWLDGIVRVSDFCGFSKFDTGWSTEKWKDAANTEFEPYQNPLVKKLALHETWIEDQRGIYRKQNLFNKFLIDTKEVGPELTKSEKLTRQERSDVPADLWAQSIMNVGANRYNCTSLRDALKSVIEKTDEIEKAMQYCNSKNKNWLDTSLEGRVKSKLKIFKEGRMIEETITNKLKSKKNFKSLKENFEKQNYRKFFDSLSSLQKNNNSLNEATNEEFEKSFDLIFKGKETEFKNRAVEYILNKLGVSATSEMGKNIKTELDKLPAKEMFRNEYDVPEAVSVAVEKSASTNVSDEQGLKGIVSKSIKFDDKQIKQGVRQHLHDYVEGVKSDIKALEEKLKKSIIQK